MWQSLKSRAAWKYGELAGHEWALMAAVEWRDWALLRLVYEENRPRTGMRAITVQVGPAQVGFTWF